MTFFEGFSGLFIQETMIFSKANFTGQELKRMEKVANLFIGSPPIVKQLCPNNRKARIGTEIGELLSHSRKCIFLSSDHGNDLRYHGHLAGASWPNAANINFGKILGHSIDFKSNLDKISKNSCPNFFVITELDSGRRQKELIDYLNSNYSIFAETDEYLIFDLRR